MWNSLKRNEIASTVAQIENSKQNEADSVNVVRHLLYTTLDKVCAQEGITRSYMSDLEPGTRKRSLADDITILTVDLKNQVV